MVAFSVYDSLVSFRVWCDSHGIGRLADFGVGDLAFLCGDLFPLFRCGGFGAVGW